MTDQIIPLVITPPPPPPLKKSLCMYTDVNTDKIKNSNHRH